MLVQEWGQVIYGQLIDTWGLVINFIPYFIGAVIVFLIGLIVASTIGKLAEQVVRSLRVDSILQKLEVERALERGGIKLNSGAFIGGIVRWFIIVVFLLAAVNILGLTQVSDFLKEVLRYIPNVVVAALILVIALKAAEVVEQSIRGSLGTVGVRAGAIAVMVRWAIWVFAISAALLQLGVATVLIQTFITGLVVMLALAFGLAFGLGGKDAAAVFIEKIRHDLGSHR